MCRSPWVIYECILSSSSVFIVSVRLTLIAFEMGCKWQYCRCFAWYYFQDLFKITRSVPKYLQPSFFSMRSVRVILENPYNSTDTAITWDKYRFIRFDWFGLVLWHINHCRLFNAKSCYIYIIIIIVRHQHGYLWPSLATHLYRPSLAAGPQGRVPYKAVVCRF